MFDQVIADDRTRATEIRNYYSKKIMMMLLKQRQLSVYREDLRTFINTNGQIFKKDMMPLVYKLPEFYDYDNLVDELFADLNKKIVDYLKFSREFNAQCPGFETDIHGLVEEVGEDGLKRYFADCVKA